MYVMYVCHVCMSCMYACMYACMYFMQTITFFIIYRISKDELKIDTEFEFGDVFDNPDEDVNG